MKLKERLTQQQLIDLLNGNVIGIFPYMIQSGDAFYDKVYELCLGYYTMRSAEKTISPTYERLIYLVQDNADINKTPEQLLGTLIRGKFLNKWNRVYEALVTAQYDALHNKDYSDTKKGTIKNTDTHDTVKATIGNNTDVTTYDTAVESDGKTATNETTTRDVTEDNDVYGFNSVDAVGDNKSKEVTSETLVGEADKNTTHNLQTKTGVDNRQIGVDESETYTGTDVKDIEIDDVKTNKGRDVSGAELITEELTLRNTQLFFDIVYADIDSITTLQIYI